MFSTTQTNSAPSVNKDIKLKSLCTINDCEKKGSEIRFQGLQAKAKLISVALARSMQTHPTRIAEFNQAIVKTNQLIENISINLSNHLASFITAIENNYTAYQFLTPGMHDAQLNAVEANMLANAQQFSQLQIQLSNQLLNTEKDLKHLINKEQSQKLDNLCKALLIYETVINTALSLDSSSQHNVLLANQKIQELQDQLKITQNSEDQEAIQERIGDLKKQRNKITLLSR